MAYEVNKIQSHFKELESIIIAHKDRAYQAVNTELVTTYWEVGKYVSEKIKTSGWGTGIVDNLVSYLKTEHPDLKGYTRRNIYRMVQFYESYSNNEFVPTALAQIEISDNKADIIVPTLLAQFEDGKILSLLVLVNWSSHIEILAGCKSDAEMIFYILLAFKEQLKVRELCRQIESGIYERSLLGERVQSPKLKETYPSARVRDGALRVG